jgi:hypothetical protein
MKPCIQASSCAIHHFLTMINVYHAPVWRRVCTVRVTLHRNPAILRLPPDLIAGHDLADKSAKHSPFMTV